MTQLLANCLSQEEGYKVFVLSKSDNHKAPFYILDSKVDYFTLDNTPYHGAVTVLRDIYLLYRFIKKNKIDILVNVDVALGLFSIPLKLFLPRLKQIFWEHFCVHYNANNSRMASLRRLALKFGDAYITLTPQDAKFLKENYKPNCLVLDIPNICSYQLTQEPYNSKSKIIISAGNLITAKGFDLALSAATHVAKSHPDWRWEIYGDGSEKENLIKQAKDLGVDNFVSFMGRTNDLKPIYKSASIYVLPSRSEGFGLVLIEAQSHRLPIVTFDVPYGPRNIVTHEENGFLVEPFDTVSLASAICELIENPEKRKQFSDKAIKNLDRYHANSVLKMWKNLLGGL